jgi:AraC family transcriptional regulator
MKLGGWLQETGTNGGPIVCLYYDDPKVTPVEQLRSDAGAVVPENFATDDPRVHMVDLRGGTYAVTTHVGPYDGLGPAWEQLVGKWLPSSGYSWGDGPCFELYLNDCREVGPENAKTELCLPVTRDTA